VDDRQLVGEPCPNIKGADGQTIGWIYRDVLLQHFGGMLRAQTPF
jgi:hypothetical protein